MSMQVRLAEQLVSEITCLKFAGCQVHKTWWFTFWNSQLKKMLTHFEHPTCIQKVRTHRSGLSEVLWDWWVHTAKKKHWHFWGGVSLRKTWNMESILGTNGDKWTLQCIYLFIIFYMICHLHFWPEFWSCPYWYSKEWLPLHGHALSDLKCKPVKIYMLTIKWSFYLSSFILTN